MQRAFPPAQLEIDAERLQHIGRARARRDRPVAVLGDRHAGPATTKAAQVDTLKRALAVAAGAAVSIAPSVRSTVTALARIARAAPAISSMVSPRTRMPRSRAPICVSVAGPTSSREGFGRLR